MNATVLMLADEAARLLPEPPASHDAFGYLAWEELVVTTARRLSQFGGIEDSPTAAITLTQHSARLDGPALLTLATLLADPADAQAGERALWLAVALSRPPADRTGSAGSPRGERPNARPITRRAPRRRALTAHVKN